MKIHLENIFKHLRFFNYDFDTSSVRFRNRIANQGVEHQSRLTSAAYLNEKRKLRIIEVDNAPYETLFLDLPKVIYRNDPNWIPCIKSEIRNVFDSAVNPYFKHGAVKRWIVADESGEALGRIAAFVNFKKMCDSDGKTGCIGFFESVNDESVAFMLFDTAIQWLVETYQITQVEGPVNFGENDKYWGLLISGYTQPSYGMNYNPVYYKSFFDAYGFEICYRQFTNFIDLQKPLPARFGRIAGRTLQNKRYAFKPFNYKLKDAFIKDFVSIYNQAWSSFRNFQPMDVEVVRKSLTEMKSIIQEHFIWFAYADRKPAGFLMAIPDVNEVIKYSGDTFNLWGKLKFSFYKSIRGFSRIRVIVMGIIPEFQQHGLESGLIAHAYEEGQKRSNFKHVELSWVGDFNDKMIALHKAMGAVEDKQHATFRKRLNYDFTGRL